MKNFRLTSIIILSFCLSKALAQCPSNGTHTDPTPGLSPAQGGATPSNGTFQQNTFDWTGGCYTTPQSSTGTILSINDPNGGGAGIPTYQSLTSPFWEGNVPIPPYSASCNSDFYPKDGWELIKQDFGYYYSGGTYLGNGVYSNGTWNGSELGGSGAQHDPRGTSTTIKYFILYNKYSALLRIMCYMPNYDPQNTIYTKLRFLTNNDYTDAGDNYTPQVNALFNHYNPNVSLALDQKTTVTEISAPCAFPADITGRMFYTDFQLAYDPCLCVFQSGLEVDFYSITQANLQLTGTYAGTSSPIDIANVNSSGIGSIYGSNSSENFITSVFEQGFSPQSSIQSYVNAANISNYNGGGGSNTVVQDALSGLSTLLGAGSDVAEASGTGPMLDTEEGYAVITKDALDGASKVTSFFAGIVGQSSTNKPPPAAVSIDAGYLQASGTITYPPSLYHDFNFKIGIPGSKNANTYPEYGMTGTGTSAITIGSGEVLPNSPMYNEAPGLFALLKTPVVEEWKDVELYPYYDPSNNLPPFDYTHFYHHALGDLVYALNPIVDANNTKIYVRYEVDGMPIEPNPMNSGPHNYSYYDYTIQGADILSNNNYGDQNPICLYNTSESVQNNYNKLVTPVYDIGCNSNIFVTEKYHSTTNVNNDSQGGVNSCFFYPVKATRRVVLVVLLDMISVPDQYNNTHHSVHIQKYPCTVIQSTDDFLGHSNLSTYLPAIAGAQTNLNLNTAVTYNTAQDIYSFGKITITANQTNNTPSNGAVNIIAEDEIDVTAHAGSSVAFTGTGNIGLYTQGLPDAFAACSSTALSPLTNLSAYCSNTGAYAASTANPNGTGYQANTSKTANTPPLTSNSKGAPFTSATTAMVQTKLGTNITLGIFPNPTSGVVYLNLSAQYAGNLIVNLSDATGNAVMHTSYSANAGANSYKLDLSTLNSGVYFIHITDENGVTIKNDKLVLMGQ